MTKKQAVYIINTMIKCPECDKEFHDKAALAAHIFHKHRNPQLRLNAREINARLTALEHHSQGIEKSIIAVTEAFGKYFQTLSKEVQAEAKASFTRDKGLLDRLKRISRNSTKHDHDILEIIDGLRGYNQSPKSVNTEEVVNTVLKARAQK